MKKKIHGRRAGEVGQYIYSFSVTITEYLKQTNFIKKKGFFNSVLDI
jgi:hypothetical protein